MAVATRNALEIRRRASVVLLFCASGASCVVHLAASLGAPSVQMAWVMAAMAVACLVCLIPLHAPQGGTSRHCLSSASHLMVMSVVMIAVHLLWIVMSSRSGGHQHGRVSSLNEHGHGSHAAVMLLVIAVELACLMAATASRRLAEGAPKRKWASV